MLSTQLISNVCGSKRYDACPSSKTFLLPGFDAAELPSALGGVLKPTTLLTTNRHPPIVHCFQKSSAKK
jgi:hypothetical protein